MVRASQGNNAGVNPLLIEGNRASDVDVWVRFDQLKPSWIARSTWCG
jgi:hypothetical protein